MLSKLLFNPITFILITAFCLVFSLSLYNSAKKTREAAEQLNVLEQNIVTMEKELEMLKESATEAQQPFTKEQIIRDELLMQKPGEYVVQIPDETEIELTTEQTTPSPSPWAEWKKILF